MRTTIVPAQMTTIEDKIAGDLSFLQIILLLSALIVATVIYLMFPVRLHFTLYKIPLILGSTIILGLLALRIKEKIILQWILLLTTYNLRPRYFVYDKNDWNGREKEDLSNLLNDSYEQINNTNLVGAKARSSKKSLILSDQERLKLDKIITQDSSSVRFIFNRKGGMNVSVKKI